MIKSKEKRKPIKKSNRMKDRAPEVGYSETSVTKSRWKQGMSSQEKLWHRHHNEYSYNVLGDNYNSWQNRYRNNQSGIYNNFYDTDDNETYGYQLKRNYHGDYYDNDYYDDDNDDNDYYSDIYYDDDEYDDDYYDDTEYSSYYDEDDTEYTEKKLGERSGRMLNDSHYLYRYEELNPGYKYNHSNKKGNKQNIKSEVEYHKHRNHNNVFAINNVIEQKGLNYKKRNSIDTSHTSVAFSENDLGYHRRLNRKRKPEYNVYSTFTPTGAAVLNKKIKRPSPEKLPQKNYKEIPMLAFKMKNRKNESDVYLPIINDKKPAQQRHLKSRLNHQNSTESAEKPLEDNLNVYKTTDSEKYNISHIKKNRESEHNLNMFKTNQKGINVYAVSSGPSQVFRKSVTNKSSIKPDDFTEQVPDTRSSFVPTTNTNASSKIFEPTESSGSVINPLKTKSMEVNRKSRAQSIGNSEKRASQVNKDKSIAPKNSTARKVSSINNDDTDKEGKNMNYSVLRQSYVPPSDTSVVNKRSLASGQNTQRSNIVKQSSVAPNRSMINKSYIADPQNLSDNQEQLPNNTFSGFESEGQNINTSRSKQSIADPNSAARQSNILTENKVSSEQKKSLTKPQKSILKLKGLLRKPPKQSLVRQSSSIQKDKSFLNSDLTTGSDEQTMQSLVKRNTEIKGQSFVARDQVGGTEKQSTAKSLRQSGAAQRSQSFAGRDQIKGFDDESNQKSMAKQSSMIIRGQSITDQAKKPQGQSYARQSNARQSNARQSNATRASSSLDRNLRQDKDNENIKKSVARDSRFSEPKQSTVARDQTMGTQRQSTPYQNTLPKQSGVFQRDNSFEDEDNKLGTEGDRTKSLGIEGQIIDKSLARQMSVDRKSKTRQSNVTEKGQSSARDQVSEGKKSQTSKIMKNSVVENGQGGRKSSYGEQLRNGGKSQTNEILQPQMNVFGEGDQRKSSVVKQPSLLSRSSNVKQPQQSAITKKSKSKTGMKRTLSKLTAFTKKKSQPEKDQISSDTSPMIDMIMTEENMEEQSQIRQSNTQKPQKSIPRQSAIEPVSDQSLGPVIPEQSQTGQPNITRPEKSISGQSAIEPVPKESIGPVKQQAASTVSTKSKKSNKSRLTKPFKGLLRRSKKSDARLTQPSNTEDIQTTEQSDLEYKQFDGQEQKPYEEEPYDQRKSYNDAFSSEDKSRKKFSRKSDDSSDSSPPTMKGYNLTNALNFIQIAQFFIGVTMYDKFMDIFEVAYY